MHHGQTLTRIIVLVAGVLVIGVSVRAAAGAALPASSPSASPSVEPTATPEPASQVVVHRALKQRQRAVSAWHEWNRARSALSLRVVRFGAHSAAKPDRAESRARWLATAAGWKLDLDEYRSRTNRLVDRMRAPGGTSSGTRWAPLLRWLRYPESIIPTFVCIIGRESSGRVRAVNPSSGCAGLLQFQPAWYRGQWGYPAFNPFDPEANLRAGLHLWREVGMQPWAL